MNKRTVKLIRANTPGVRPTDRAPISVIPNSDSPPCLHGRPGYWTTPSGAICRYPSAYRARFGRPTYHRSTRRIKVGELWVRLAEEGHKNAIHERRQAAARKAVATRYARAHSVLAPTVEQRLDLARCPYCATRIQGVSPTGLQPIHAVECPSCGALHHADCREEHAHCGRYGCGQTLPTAPTIERSI